MSRTYKTIPFKIDDEALYAFLQKADENFDHILLLNSNEHQKDPYQSHSLLIALGVEDYIEISDNTLDAFSCLKEFVRTSNDWCFGSLAYDLKNQIENLSSCNSDYLNMPLLYFFRPLILVQILKEEIIVGLSPKASAEFSFEDVIGYFKGTYSESPKPILAKGIQSRISKGEYISKIEEVKQYIKRGDIYEMNFCMEFYADNAVLNPLEQYIQLNITNPTPFSCFLKLSDKYLLSSTPERFLAKRGEKLISQPIKGTIKRGASYQEDECLKQQLKNDPKERSENIMIVDLVRNDLSRSATTGTVKVDELCGIYSYPSVHQMISTISCKMHPDLHSVDVIKRAFPMGSMTGAPKIRAMEIAEELESTKRGLYSGAVGYFDPNQDFDFNVVIRSILYNTETQYLSFMVGGAITDASNPYKEYEECLLKAQSMKKSLGL